MVPLTRSSKLKEELVERGCEAGGSQVPTNGTRSRLDMQDLDETDSASARAMSFLVVVSNEKAPSSKIAAKKRQLHVVACSCMLPHRSAD